MQDDPEIAFGYADAAGGFVAAVTVHVHQHKGITLTGGQAVDRAAEGGRKLAALHFLNGISEARRVSTSAATCNSSSCAIEADVASSFAEIVTRRLFSMLLRR